MALKVCVLAAGKGVRMRSELPKVLHTVAGEPMIAHVLRAVRVLKPRGISVVVGSAMESVMEAALRADPHVKFAVQQPPLGTAHAVRAAQSEWEGFEGIVLVVYGDTPLITADTLRKAIEALQADDAAQLAVIGMQMIDPTGYGRLICASDGTLEKIVECRHANEAEKAITLCNSGIMAFAVPGALPALAAIMPQPTNGEFYLTDMVEHLRRANARCLVVAAPAEQLQGVNSRAQLAQAEAQMQQRLRTEMMERGVTLIAPETVFFSSDTMLGQDVIVEPNVIFGPNVLVGPNVRICSFSHIEGATIAAGARIGPFARIRPGTVLEEGAHVGNFVELKKTILGKGASANHLSYLGDASIGAHANIGAGTITCNYDGYEKHATSIGEGAFIGSNASLVAPVNIGKGAVIGAGSVITEDVAADAVAVARGEQVQHPQGAVRLRTRKQKKTKSLLAP